MFRRVVRVAAVVLAAAGMSAGVLAAAQPASAATTYAICETNGIYCLNAASLTPYSPVTESLNNYRGITAALQSSKYNTYLLEFNADNGKCVAGTNDGTAVVVKYCSGSTGVIWVLKSSNGSDMWVNQAASQKFGVDMYLTGQGNNGSQFKLFGLGANGMYQRFHLQQESA
jgi:hypothetical protein